MSDQMLPPEYQSQIDALRKKQLLAQLLQKQGLNPQMAQSQGRMAARTSPLSFLSSALSAYVGAQGDAKADAGISGVKQRYATDTSTAIDKLFQTPEADQQLFAAKSQNPQVQALAKAMLERRQRMLEAGATIAGKTDPNAGLGILRTGAFPDKPVAGPTTTVNGQVVPANQPGAYRDQYGPTESLPGADGKPDLYQRVAGTGKLVKLDNAPKTTVTATSSSTSPSPAKGEEAFIKALGGDMAGEFKEARGAAKQAYALNGVIKQMSELDARGIFSGPTANLAVILASFGESLNLPVDKAKLANSEAYQQQFAKQISSLILNSSVGRSMTDTDRKAIEQSLPTLLQSPQGRQMLYKQINAASTATIARHKTFQDNLIKQYPQASGLLTMNPVDESPGFGVNAGVPETVPGAPTGPGGTLRYNPTTKAWEVSR